MRIISSLTKLISIVAVSAVLFACGNRATSNDGSAQHPSTADWVKQHPATARLADNGVSSGCASCHGADLSGGIAKVSCMSTAPVLGFSCHATSPVDTPSGCVSCHGVSPEGPNGTNFPNRQLSHGVHTRLPGVTCAACHNGLGPNGAHHADGTQVVSFSAVADARTSAAVYTPDTPGKPTDGGTCSNISCHGGQATPNWNAVGTITLVNGNNVVCWRCHQPGTAEYNSYNSGRFIPVPDDPNNAQVNLHAFHLTKEYVEARASQMVPLDPAPTAKVQSYVSDGTIYCTDCHDLNILKNPEKHFGGIVSKSLNAPGETIFNTAGTNISTYDTATSSCGFGAVACHASGFGGSWK